MKQKLAGLLVLAGMALPMAAHHSFDAEYDRTKSRDFTGTVTKVEWMNPHARFYMDVKDADGKVTNWEFELGSPASCALAGLVTPSKRAMSSSVRAAWRKTVRLWPTLAP